MAIAPMSCVWVSFALWPARADMLCCAVACCVSRVCDMLPRCADAGISVKYGRKVLQRLQAVGPARKALTSALASRSPGLVELEEALGAAKVCRCLLEDDLMQVRRGGWHVCGQRYM